MSEALIERAIPRVHPQLGERWGTTVHATRLWFTDRAATPLFEASAAANWEIRLSRRASGRHIVVGHAWLI